MIIRNTIYVAILILQFRSYCLGLCRTTNDHKNHTCNGHRFNQITLSLSTRLELLRERIYNCQETEIKEGKLTYPKLENLTVSCGTIIDIHKNAFLNFNHLRELDLSNNSLSSFVANVFSPLGHLHTLNVSQNNFKNLPENTFSGLRELKELILSRNRLTDFDSKVFDQTRSVEILYLDFNEINFLPVRLLKKMRKLRYLDLSNNFIKNFGEVFFLSYNLQYLNLSSNVIDNIPIRAFQTTRLEVLDLSNNKLKVIYEDGLQLKTLKQLHLQNNKIRWFEVGGLNMDSLPLELLNVENNRLVFLENDFIQAVKNLRIFKMSKNPWDCECLNKMETMRKKSDEEDDGPLCVVGITKVCQINNSNLDYYYNKYTKQLNEED